MATYNSDKIRYNKLQSALMYPLNVAKLNYTYNELKSADDLTLAKAYKRNSGDVDVIYVELWTDECLKHLFKKPEYFGLNSFPKRAIMKFFTDRFINIAKSLQLSVVDYDIIRHNDEFILKVTLHMDNSEILNEVDFNRSGPIGDPRYQVDPIRADLRLKNMQNDKKPEFDDKFNRVYMSKPKTQDPRQVDRLLKSIFEEKFSNKHTLSTDVGDWKPVKVMTTEEGKLFIQWEHAETNKVKIMTTFFMHNSNKIFVKAVDGVGKELINTDFEIYRIPTDEFLVERFFRKIYFNIMKKFVNTQVIKLTPFNLSFVFWKSENPYFSYSFSEPKKNQIILDLIGFIRTAEKPILDDFFEQNNLKHKQGYLQTLLDAAEDAGIFTFTRQGNEVIINKGVNFKSFLEGRIRKI